MKMTKKIKAAHEKVLSTLVDQYHNNDAEETHYNADKALCDFLTEIGFSEVADAFNKIPNKYYA